MQLYVNLQLSQNKNLYSFLKRDIQIWRLQNPRTVFTPTVPSKEQTEVTGGVCKVDLSLLFLQQLPTSWSDVCNPNSATRARALGRWRAPDMALGLYLYLIHPLSHSHIYTFTWAILYEQPHPSGLKLSWKRTPMWELSRSYSFQAGTERKWSHQRRHTRSVGIG